ncbi:HTH-type transcriptional activator IlvY [Marinomonas sp. THO17]|uniref:HTH-type transcriptional activator IlvY n=1 Tax=Marinomonas sp. THO17 TaxID=3149048 RepID=UPI00336C2D2A
MNSKAIKHFLALAESLHFGRASEECHISISALSRNIRQLEEEVGVALFARDNRTVTLTQEGKKFLVYAREASSQWRLIRHELSDNSDQLHGEISIYCSVTASYSFLFDLLNRFRQVHPGIEIKLHTGDPDDAISRILDGKEDLTIAARPDNMHPSLAFKPITFSPLVFIAPNEQHLPSVPTVPPGSFEAWAQVPMIVSEAGVSRNRVDNWFYQHNISPKIYAQVAGNEAIVSMVSLGFGIGVVPKIVLDNSPLQDRVKIWPVLPELAPYDIGLFTLQKNLKNPMISAFWELMVERRAT